MEEELSFCEGGEECIGCEDIILNCCFHCSNCSREIKIEFGYTIPVQYLINRPHMQYKSREILRISPK